MRRPAGTSGSGRSMRTAVVVAHPALGGVERRPRRRLLVARLGAQLAGRDLRRALEVCRRRSAARASRPAPSAPSPDAGRSSSRPRCAARFSRRSDLRRGLLGPSRGVLLRVEPRPPLRVRTAEHRSARRRTAPRCRPSARAATRRGSPRRACRASRGPSRRAALARRGRGCWSARRAGRWMPRAAGCRRSR